MTYVCSRYNASSDWLILHVGHYSPVMPMGRLRTSKNQAESHIIINHTINLERSVFYGKISNLCLAVLTLHGQYGKVLV